MSTELSITEQISYAVSRIECDLPGGQQATGTGFFFTFDVEAGRLVPVLITNKHVIEGAVEARFLVCAADADGNPVDRSHITAVVKDQSQWLLHPNAAVDLAALPVATVFSNTQADGRKAFHKSLNLELVPSSSELADLSVFEEVVMVGYPSGIWDSINNQPIFRQGATATHPAKDYEARKEFMIDAACFPGSSGSPVFLLNLGSYTTRTATILGTPRVKLLGVLYAGPQFTAAGDIVVKSVPTATGPVSLTQIPLNLGMVIRSELLEDFLPQINALLA